jgi:Fe2+ or Zn2+ uptake regulation protein
LAGTSIAITSNGSNRELWDRDRGRRCRGKRDARGRVTRSRAAAVVCAAATSITPDQFVARSGGLRSAGYGPNSVQNCWRPLNLVLGHAVQHGAIAATAISAPREPGSASVGQRSGSGFLQQHHVRPAARSRCVGPAGNQGATAACVSARVVRLGKCAGLTRTASRCSRQVSRSRLEEIADDLGGRMTESDVASVYRSLETLCSVGLVRHVHAGHGPGGYVLEGAGDQEYLACESCGALKPVEPSPLDGVRGAVRRLSDFEARFSHFPIVGLCARCASKKTEAAERGMTRCRFESGLRHRVSAFSPIRPIPAGGTLPGIGRVDMPLLGAALSTASTWSAPSGMAPRRHCLGAVGRRPTRARRIVAARRTSRNPVAVSAHSP